MKFKNVSVIGKIVSEIAYFIFMFLILFLLLFFFQGEDESIIGATLTAVIISFFALLIIVAIAAATKKIAAHEASSILVEDCDPIQYLEKVKELPKLTRYLDTQLIYLQYLKVLAYFFLNEKQQAREALSELIIWQYKTKRKEKKLYLLTAICSASRISKNLELFEENYKRLGELLGDSKRSSYDTDARKHYDGVGKKLEYINQDNYEGLINFLDDEARSVAANQNLTQVRIEFEKATYFEKLKEYKNMQRSLEFVVEKGNKLNLVAEAKEKLAALSTKSNNREQ